MKKVVVSKNRISRESLCNSFSNNTLRDRLIKSKAIDYNENYFIEDLGNDYIRILPQEIKTLSK